MVGFLTVVMVAVVDSWCWEFVENGGQCWLMVVRLCLVNGWRVTDTGHLSMKYRLIVVNDDLTWRCYHEVIIGCGSAVLEVSPINNIVYHPFGMDRFISKSSPEGTFEGITRGMVFRTFIIFRIFNIFNYNAIFRIFGGGHDFYYHFFLLLVIAVVGFPWLFGATHHRGSSEFPLPRKQSGSQLQTVRNHHFDGVKCDFQSEWPSNGLEMTSNDILVMV